MEEIATGVNSLYTNARRFVGCPFCKAEKGKLCLTRSGNESRKVHDARTVALKSERPDIFERSATSIQVQLIRGDRLPWASP